MPKFKKNTSQFMMRFSGFNNSPLKQGVMHFDVTGDGQVVDTPYEKDRTFRWERDRDIWIKEQKRLARKLKKESKNK